MPRGNYKRVSVHADPVHNSFEVQKLINYVMIDGKKDVARKVVYETLEKLKEISKDSIEVLGKAIANATPAMEVRARRLGGASYMVPTEVRRERKLFLALNWIVEGAKAKSSREHRSFSDKLFAEIKDAYSNVGFSVTKKQGVEKQAEQNKAFAHLKW